MNKKIIIKQVLVDFFSLEENNVFVIEELDLDLLTEALLDSLERNHES